MKLDCFQIEGNLLPFLANLCLSKFEFQINQKLQYYPRISVRSVNQVLLYSIREPHIHDFMALLNNKICSIKLTLEIGNKEQQYFPKTEINEQCQPLPLY